MQFNRSNRNGGLAALSPRQRQIAYQHFDEKYYRSSNPDAIEKNSNLFEHYLHHGWRQGRNPNSSFNTLEYLLQNPSLIGSGEHPLFHYLFGHETHGLTNTYSNDGEISPVGDKFHIDLALPELPELPELCSSVNGESHSSTSTAIAPIPENEALKGLSSFEIEQLHLAFDKSYYLRENPDVRLSGIDPFIHYMTVGWLEQKNPSPEFSTKFYLYLYKDIAASGMNPFIHWVLHGKTEKRSAISFRQKIAMKAYKPKVSVIVPNYNHGRFLAQRLDSIIAQSYENIEITILDDCSSDNSREVIDYYTSKYPGLIKSIYNKTNSGGVFNQWRKGVESTDGELIWICESDDFCEPDFAEKLVPYFGDDSIQMAFGRILETDVDGIPNNSLDGYRERAEEGIWQSSLVRPSADWFSNGFGVSNVIANVGGCLFRRSPIPADIWQEAATYSVVGDWYLYLKIASGGQIAWEPAAISYFRRHGSNTSSSSFTRPKFYSELERVMLEMRKTWEIPESTVVKFYDAALKQYAHFKVEKEHGPFDQHCNLDKLISVRREKGHILLAILGFIPGGGENFPIQLANSLVKQGWIVSMLIFDSDEVNEYMRQSLNPAVSVYDSSWVAEYGCARFVRDAGISLVHSHTIGAEMRFYDLWNSGPELPYVVTLHGSYEASDIPAELMFKITRFVDHFVYTADKNLLPLDGLSISDDRFTKMANAMPIDPTPYPQTRADMGIAEDAIIFTLVARGIKRKGWRAAIEAFCNLRSRNPQQPMHLCLVGEGEEPDLHRKTYQGDPDISFLGYQSRIHGLYKMSDVAIAPTRFAGESYPLCIIQSLQAGTPVIASDIGEISRMLVGDDGQKGGIIVKAVRDTNEFIASFANAMEEILDDSLRRELSKNSQQIAKRYNMDPLVESYSYLYKKVLKQHGSAIS